MRLLRRNVVLIYGVYAATLVSGLVVTPIILGALGTEQFGIWALIGSILGFIGLLDFGIGPSVIRFAAEQRGRGAHDGERADLDGLRDHVGLAVVTMLLTLVLASCSRTSSRSRISPCVRRRSPCSLCRDVLMRFPVGLFGYLLAGQQRSDVLDIGNLLGSFLCFGLAVMVLSSATAVSWRWP